MAAKSLKEKTANGLLWGSINSGAQQLLNLVFGIFLARLLSPADYGMVGMLTIFTLIASTLQESGFISGLNRKKDITDADYNAVFWFNVHCPILPPTDIGSFGAIVLSEFCYFSTQHVPPCLALSQHEGARNGPALYRCPHRVRHYRHLFGMERICLLGYCHSELSILLNAHHW